MGCPLISANPNRSRVLPTVVGVTCMALLVAASTMSTLDGQAPAPGPGQPAAPPPPQAGHPSGRLVIWGDLSLFIKPGDPDNCILTNRFKKGQRIGIRMTAFDGGTGEVENTAVMVAHLTVGGKTIDVPMRWRGANPPALSPTAYTRSPLELWVGSWTVPPDAPTGTVSYTVTATDSVRKDCVLHALLLRRVAARHRRLDWSDLQMV